MMQAADLRDGDDAPRVWCLDSSRLRTVFRQRQVCPTAMVQVINTTPILLKSEKSGMRGIRGAVGK